ncbi:MAG: hypothetical protein HXM41_01690 [Lachnospiraceae bacterium]|nr:hypothetical protein [Lachnospiraceae bacterium]MBS4936718.1 hypothetical protein [Lachnospiraceae bacterium]RKW30994.1 MAG: hypothetical protein D8B43_07865 [Lachnoanaerobaculum sp.]
MRRRKRGYKKLVIAGLMVAALGFSGATYAGWLSEQHIAMGMGTDVFDAIFKGSEEDYKVELSDGTDVEGLETSIKANFTDDKTLSLTFEKGLPKEILTSGKYLKISYPIDSKDTDKKLIAKEKAADFTKPTAVAKAESYRSLLSYNGSVYELADKAEEFAVPVEFNTYSAVERNDKDQLIGVIYVAPTQETLDAMNAVPTTFEISQADLDGLQTVDNVTADGDGIMVQYQTTFDLMVDQNKADNK